MRNFNRGRSRGFSLTEMLVVIGIIVLLLGIAVPTLITTRRAAEIAKAKADLQAIAMAIEQYKNDFNDYPRSPVGTSGSRVLAWALIAPFAASQDGYDGPGFRTVTGGKVWGPYLATDKFRLSSDNLSILDSYGTPIEYYPRWKSAGAATNLFSTGTPVTGLYDHRSSVVADTSVPLPYYLMKALGDDNLNNVIDNGEVLKQLPPFLLISAGLDKAFSDKPSVQNKFNKCDEITNLAP